MAMPSTVDRRGPRKVKQIFTATLSLLSERGYDGLTIEGVAARSGVNKTTIYRWWPSKDALLAAALLDSDLLTLSIPDTGALRGDLIALAESVSELLTGPQTGAVVAALRAAGTGRKELTELAASLFAARQIRERAIFDRAIQRGELSPDTDSKTIVDLLEGGLWVRLLLRGETLPPNYVATIVDAVLDGVRRPDRIGLHYQDHMR